MEVIQRDLSLCWCDWGSPEGFLLSSLRRPGHSRLCSIQSAGFRKEMFVSLTWKVWLSWLSSILYAIGIFTTIFSTFSIFCACFICRCGLNRLQNASVLFVWSCLFAWAQYLPVSRLQRIRLQFQWTKEPEGKGDAFLRLSDKIQVDLYPSMGRLREHDWRKGWNLSLMFQQDYY